MFQRVGLTVDGTQHPAHLLDVSPHGARGHSQARVVTGMRVIVHTGGHSALGEVMWARDGRFGLRFALPLPSTAIAALVDQGTL